MTNETFDPEQQAEFDKYATLYEAMHAKSVSASGAPPEYFAVYKQELLQRMLGAGYDRPILDFGCGIGNLTTKLTESFPIVHGYDPSAKCVNLAQRRAPGATFFYDVDALAKNHYGTAIVANVLHHVAPADRPALIRAVISTLAPGGRLVIFEHNPLNPLTRHAVAICPFDDNAILLYPGEVKRLLQGGDLAKVALDYIVFFPSALAAARPFEPSLNWLPIGAQVCAWGFRA